MCKGTGFSINIYTIYAYPARADTTTISVGNTKRWARNDPIERAETPQRGKMGEVMVL